MRLIPLIALAATHCSSEELLLVFVVSNSGLTGHRNQEDCKHLPVLTVTSVGNLEMVMQSSRPPPPLRKFSEAFVPGGDTQRAWPSKDTVVSNQLGGS